MQLDMCSLGITQKKKAGLVLESFAPKPVMYYNFVAPFVLSFVMYVCLCSLFLETDRKSVV